MTKRFFKQFCIGLLLIFSLSLMAPSSVLAESGEKEMKEFCDSWDENVSDYSDQSHCWSCEIFILLFDAANIVAGQINGVLSGSAQSVVIVGGVLWLAFYTLIHFGALISSEQDPMEYLTKVGTIMLRIGFGYAFLAGGASFAFDYIISPVLSTGASLANETLSVSNRVSAKMATDVTTNTGHFSPVDSIIQWTQKGASRIEGKWGKAASAVTGNLFNINGSLSGPMGQGVRDSLKQMIAQMASSMAEAQAIAQGLRCGSPFWLKIDATVPIIGIGIVLFIPNPLMWIFGAWMGCIFWVISILFSFAMLDVIFRIGLVVSMMPIFIAAWVFPITGQFAKAAWDMFLNTVMVFVLTGLTAVFIVILVETSWDAANGSNDAGSVNSFMSSMKNSNYVTAWDDLWASKGGFYALISVSIVTMWGWVMAPKSDAMAKKFIGGSFSSSVAIKAIKALLTTLFDIISLVLTIITWGAASCIYVLQFAKWIGDAAKAVQKIQNVLKKIEKAQKRIQDSMKKVKDVKDKVNKVRDSNVMQLANKLTPNGDMD